MEDLKTQITALTDAERDAIHALSGNMTVARTATVVGLAQGDVAALAKRFGWPDVRKLKSTSTAIRALAAGATDTIAPAVRPSGAGVPPDLDVVVDRFDEIEQGTVLRHRSESPVSPVPPAASEVPAGPVEDPDGPAVDVATDLEVQEGDGRRGPVEHPPTPEDGLAGQLRQLDELAGVGQGWELAGQVSGRPSATLTMPLLWLHGADGLLAVISEAVAEVSIRPQEVLAHLVAGTPMPLRAPVTQRLTSAGRLHIAELAALLEHNSAPA